MNGALRIATRASELALRRARAIQAMLAARGTESELVTFRTLGDKQFEETLSPAELRTTFTRELETAVLKGKADIAVHALSDMSTDPAPGLTIAGVLARDDPRDVLMLNRLLEATPIEELPRGSRIGTSSVRCRSFLRATYPDLEVVHLRGDLPTRLHKVDEGQVHGTVVSAAALQRLEVRQSVVAYLEPPRWLPTPGQGAIAIQVRDNDAQTRDLVGPLSDASARVDTSAERAMLAALEGGLQSPVGALVVGEGEARVLYGAIADLEGREMLKAQLPMDDSQPELVGVRVANELRAKGASRILDALRRASRIPAPQPDP
jgi:hydroxymethylbilane synthase